MTIRPSAMIGKITPKRRACMWAIVFFMGLVPVSAATELYVETVIDSSGQLRITTNHKSEIVPKKDREQTGFGDAKISPDMKAVGWLALFPNCCAPAPVALKLVILVSAGEREYVGNGLPILRWCFWAGGKQVALEQQTARGGMAVHYELRNVATGELVDRYDPDANPDSVTKPPRWVVVLDSKG